MQKSNDAQSACEDSLGVSNVYRNTIQTSDCQAVSEILAELKKLRNEPIKSFVCNATFADSGK